MFFGIQTPAVQVFTGHLVLGILHRISLSRGVNQYLNLTAVPIVSILITPPSHQTRSHHVLKKSPERAQTVCELVERRSNFASSSYKLPERARMGCLTRTLSVSKILGMY